MSRSRGPLESPDRGSSARLLWTILTSVQLILSLLSQHASAASIDLGSGQLARRGPDEIGHEARLIASLPDVSPDDMPSPVVNATKKAPVVPGDFIVHVRKRQSAGAEAGMDPGLEAMVKTFRKYPQWNITMPDGSTGPSLAPPQNGALPLLEREVVNRKMSYNVNNREKRAVEGVVAAVPANKGAEFVSPVTVGGQRVNLAFDSGSSDLWVFSSTLPSGSKGKHLTYNAQLSPNSKRLKTSRWNIKYGDGSSASGGVVLDTVEIGGIEVANQAVEVATQVSPQFVTDPGTDGLLGLAFSNLNTISPRKQTTFFDNVVSSLTYPIFSVDLATDGTGSFLFGNVNPARYRGQLQYAPVDTREGFWQFKSPTFAIGNTKFANRKASDAIADTGTSLMLVDQPVAEKYYTQVPGAMFSAGAGGWVYPCTSKLPDFAVQVGPSYMATVPGEMVTFSKTKNGFCFGGIQGNGGGMMQIFGDIFFRAQYVVFDRGTKKGAPALQMAPKF